MYHIYFYFYFFFPPPILSFWPKCSKNRKLNCSGLNGFSTFCYDILNFLFSLKKYVPRYKHGHKGGPFGFRGGGGEGGVEDLVSAIIFSPVVNKEDIFQSKSGARYRA